MARSLKKGPFVDAYLLEKIEALGGKKPSDKFIVRGRKK